MRPTQEADAAAYRELRLEALRLHPEAFGADYDMNVARPLDYWQALMQRGSGTETGIIYVAERDTTRLGMAVLVRGDAPKVRHTADIYSVYVAAAERGLGIADALLHACLSWGQTAGVRVVKLAAVSTNVAAIRLYMRCGFAVYGVDPDAILWNGAYYDELLMARRLQ